MKKRNLGVLLTKKLPIYVAVSVIVMTLLITAVVYFEIQKSIQFETDIMMDIIVTEVQEQFGDRYIQLDVARTLYNDNQEDGLMVLDRYYDVGAKVLPLQRLDFLTEQGILLAQIPYSEERIGFDMSRNNIYKKIVSEGEDYVLAGMGFDSNLSENVFSMAMKTSNGYVIGHFNTEAVVYLVGDIDIEDGYVAVTDYDGHYIAHTDKVKVEQQLQDANINAILDGSFENWDQVRYEGEDYLLTYRMDEVNKMVVLYYQDMAVYRRLMFAIILVVGIISMIFLPTLFILLSRIAKDIRRSLDKLVVVSRRIASGEYENEGESMVYEEFNELMVNFVDMSEQIHGREEEITALTDEIEFNYYKTVVMMANAIEAKDTYTGNHCERVRDYSLQIGEAIGLAAEALRDLRYGSILHDIGKIGIPEQVLNKTGQLTDEEYVLIKSHSRIGYEIIKDITGMPGAKDIVLYHHEFYDGKGYPDGISGEDIPLLARIVGIADAFDAMVTKRSYRTRIMTKEAALTELRRCSGTQFDAQLVRVFAKVVGEE